MVEIVVTLLWELALEVAADLCIELGFAAVAESLQRRSKARPLVAALGVVILGALGGALVLLIWPARVLAPGPLPGVSLIVSPLVNGALMDLYGGWRERRGGHRSSIATFWGGALFAFSMALVRFLSIGV